MIRELFELELDKNKASITLKARNMAFYLRMHPEESQGAFEALYDCIATLKYENAQLKNDVARMTRQLEPQSHQDASKQAQ